MTTEARTAVAQLDPAKNIWLPCGPAHVVMPGAAGDSEASLYTSPLAHQLRHTPGRHPPRRHHAPEPSDTRRRTPGSGTRTSNGGDGEPTARAGCPTPGAAPGEAGRLVPRRAAAVSVVPAPPDGSGDEPRDPPNGRAAGTLDIRRPPPLNPRQNPAATSQQEPATRPRPAATMTCRRPRPDRCAARARGASPSPGPDPHVITGRHARCRSRQKMPFPWPRPTSWPIPASEAAFALDRKRHANTDKTDSRHEARALARCYFTALVIHIT